MARYLDGVEALYRLLDNLTVNGPDGQPVTVTGSDGTQVPVPPAQTRTSEPSDITDQIREHHRVFIVLARAGWSDDKRGTEGHDRVSVGVYGPTETLVRLISQGIEDGLVDEFHDVPDVGFIDDVQIDTRWRVLPDSNDEWAHSTATYRLESRPD